MTLVFASPCPDPGDFGPDLDALLALARPRWHQYAACRGRTDVTWFPELGQSLDPALAVCDACTVRKVCLEAGLGEHGVWGGMSRGQRAELVRTRRAA